MKWSDLPLQPTPRMLQQFSAAWLVVFLAAAAYQTLVRSHPKAGCLLGVIALIGLAGLLNPSAVRWLFIGMTAVAFPIGWAMTQMVLAVMFYLVLTPLALAFRRRGRDELRLKRKPGSSSFWITCSHPRDAGSYLKQF